jgi:hypothetical protein
MNFHGTSSGALASALRRLGFTVDPDALIIAAASAGVALPIVGMSGVFSPSLAAHRRVGGASIAYSVPDERLGELREIVDRLTKRVAA